MKVYYLHDNYFDPFLVGNYIAPAHLELLYKYCLN